eukprot:CAMPEP_0113300526 /NCGR_PEP_ID=MMETSP0010_2-20120614/2118_1 /TAXON_ID=216773 ORGANISM="Corethron hystrix, Strain 308" /NCGR_SAMPLE_ID=MMETSP0010_2 /ASSEMBLY_ACC=CAM_ASM_000155 /LENGTH=196 /DNA_ID=CAMNT_0000153963 /DNA_START=258 /DNA_END=848 /DNA_ORIENTATION=- /assembly_acc=CAM_ASM_000155
MKYPIHYRGTTNKSHLTPHQVCVRPSLLVRRKTQTNLKASTENLDLIALASAQENYGFAIVCLGEAIYSFVQNPSLDHVKILVPAILSAAVLIFVSGAAITSDNASSLAFGLEIATAVSLLMGVTYVLRLINPSPSPKEAVFLGLLLALAGFSSFSQNLLVAGFVTLPSLPPLPSIQLPSVPSVELPSLPEIRLPF